MATLFLDIDDVLCLGDPYGGVHVADIFHGRCPDPATVFGALFDERAVAELRRVHETLSGRLRYVISSTWRETFSQAQLMEIFRRSGTGFIADALHDVAWCTPIDLRAERADEIAQWLDRNHRGEPFAVLDDHVSGASLVRALISPESRFHGHVVLCPGGVGAGPKQVEALLAILQPDGSKPSIAGRC